MAVRALKHPALLLAGAALAAGLLFMLAPGIDLLVSALFWRAGDGFFLRDWAPFRLIYRAVPTLTWALVVGLVLIGMTGALRGRAIGPFDRRVVAFLLLTIAIGPGLITNTLLKDHWGRARPSQIERFGGTAQFTPVLMPSDQCGRNCSFPSGHAAMGFSLVCLGFVAAPGRRRRWIIGMTIGFGGLVSLARIGQGGHFLSDTVFAGLLVGAVTLLLHHWIMTADGLNRPWIARIGRALAGRATAWLDGRDTGRQSWARVWLWRGLVAGLAMAVAVLWLDRPLALYFNAEDDRLVGWFRWITQFGLGWGWLTIAALTSAGFWAAAQNPQAGALRARLLAWSLVPAFVFLSVLASGLAADIVKILVGRTRPKLFFADGSFALTGFSLRADHWSFPSGHVTNVTALAAAWLIFWPRQSLGAALLVGLIAMSRIATGQHFLSDTIGAAFLALLVTAYIEGVFIRSGLAPADLKAGVLQVRADVSWRYRLLGW